MDSPLPENQVLLPDHSDFSAAQIDQALRSLGIVNAVVFQTSGSTGTPRLVCHSKAGLQASAAAVNELLDASASDVWLRALPLFHVGGFGIIARAEAVKSGVFELEDGWEAARFVEACKVHGASLSSLVPTQVFDLVQCEFACPASLRAVLVGGGRLDPALEKRARGLGWPVLRTYGLSEAGSQVATQVGDELVVLPHLDAAIDTEGRLKLRGSSMALGYLHRDEDRSWRFDELLGADGWFETDDLVELDGRVLRFVGRVSSKVKILGELVDVDALEQALLTMLPSGIEAALIDVEEARCGSALVLVIHNDVAPAKLEPCITAFNASVAGFERIAKVVQVSLIPRGELGKIRRGELRQMVAETQK